MTLDLQRMSRDEKLRMMHVLWEDLAKDDSQTESPEWHRRALDETEARAKSGTETVYGWEAAKAELRRRAS
jgi:hypothetical protein